MYFQTTFTIIILFYCRLFYFSLLFKHSFLFSFHFFSHPQGKKPFIFIHLLHLSHLLLRCIGVWPQYIHVLLRGTCIWQQLHSVFSQTWVVFHATVSVSGAWENLTVQLWGAEPLQTGGEEESDLWLWRREHGTDQLTSTNDLLMAFYSLSGLFSLLSGCIRNFFPCFIWWPLLRRSAHSLVFTSTLMPSAYRTGTRWWINLSCVKPYPRFNSRRVSTRGHVYNFSLTCEIHRDYVFGTPCTQTEAPVLIFPNVLCGVKVTRLLFLFCCVWVSCHHFLVRGGISFCVMSHSSIIHPKPAWKQGTWLTAEIHRYDADTSHTHTQREEHI